jgi:bifunctional DNA-binding transcriptional regulator/antitoxin component of YhaV-PrlF toxin-antitoxin module
MSARHKIKLESNGRILLPLALRKEMDVKAGDSLIGYFDTELHLIPLKSKIQECQQIVKEYNNKNISLVDALKNSRRQERNE